MKIRVDNLIKVVNKLNFFKYDFQQIWTPEFVDWMQNNSQTQVKSFIRYKAPNEQFREIMILEFYNEEDATLFALQFSS